jgi:hypothetical protein
LQAYLERARLPISDYINDTKTATDQVPRVLAAMHYIAAQDKSIASNFDLICQFSRVRQLISTRSIVDDDPLCRLAGFSADIVRRLRANAQVQGVDTPTIWSLRSSPRDKSAALLKRLLKGGRTPDFDRMVKSVFSLPFISINATSVSSEVEKTTGASIGKLRVNMTIEGGSRGNNGVPSQTSVSLVLGTPQSKRLLSQRTISIHDTLKGKDVDLHFDWSAANEGGGEGGGRMILRLLFEELRGLDVEITIPLRQ